VPVFETHDSDHDNIFMLRRHFLEFSSFADDNISRKIVRNTTHATMYLISASRRIFCSVFRTNAPWAGHMIRAARQTLLATQIRSHQILQNIKT